LLIKLFGNHLKADGNRDELTQFTLAHSSFRTGLMMKISI